MALCRSAGRGKRHLLKSMTRAGPQNKILPRDPATRLLQHKPIVREIWQAMDSNSAGQRAFPINYGRSSVYQTAASVSGCSASKAAFRFAWDMASCNICRITANAACSSAAMLFQNLINFVALQDVGHQGLDRALHGLTLGNRSGKKTLPATAGAYLLTCTSFFHACNDETPQLQASPKTNTQNTCRR